MPAGQVADVLLYLGFGDRNRQLLYLFSMELKVFIKVSPWVAMSTYITNNSLRLHTIDTP